MDEKQKDTPRGSGLFARSVFCAFILLALCSLFALHTDFSENIRSAFKLAVTEDSGLVMPKISELSLFSKIKKEEPVQYIPAQSENNPQETYPNPIIMPSQTSGQSLSSDP